MNELWSNLWILGAAAVGFVALQAVWMTVDMIRRRGHESAQRARHAELLDEQVRAARRVREQKEQKSLTWSGWRKFEIVRKECEDANQEVCSFYLKPHDRKRIPGFRPGQYLTFRLEVPGQTRPLVRCYSLSDYASEPDTYRVSIKRAPEPALASTYFLDTLDIGSIVDVRAPTGHFALDLADPSPVVLIGGGVGVTPVLSMVNAIVATPGQRETWFFFGVRNEGELVMRDHLEAIAAEHPHIHVHFCYSRLTRDEVPAHACHEPGRIDVALLKRHLPSNNYKYFICGPTVMMETITDDLVTWGVPREDVHYEDFGPPREAPTLDPGDASGPKITFRKSGKEVSWNTGAKSILDLAHAHDIEIEAGCWCGDCGTCERAIVSGEVEYDGDPNWDIESGSCLTCCCIPKGPVELDA